MEKALQHKDIIIEMVNDKIMDIYNDADSEVLDSEELDELCKCVSTLSKLAKMRYMEHCARLGFAGSTMKHVDKTIVTTM